MSLFNSADIVNIAESFQNEFREVLQNFKLGSFQDMTPNSNVSNCSTLQIQNEFLKDHVNELQKLVFQYEFTNKKALETLKENIMLRDKTMALKLQVGVLSETVDIQTLEIKKRDYAVSSLRKDIRDHNRRIEIMSENFEKNGYPACDICCRNPPIITMCKNHSEGEQIVGCVFCALQKCPMCRNKKVERSFVQLESKKIKKAPKCSQSKTLKATETENFEQPKNSYQ